MGAEYFAVISTLGEEFLTTLILDWIKTRFKKLTGKTFPKILKDCINSVASRFEKDSLETAEVMRSAEFQRDLCSALKSPKIDKSIFREVFDTYGFESRHAEKISKEIFAEFERVVEKEAAKNPEMFNELIVNIVKNLDINTTKLVRDLQPLKSKIPVIFALVTDAKERLDRIEGKLDVLDKKVDTIAPTIQAYFERLIETRKKSAFWARYGHIEQNIGRRPGIFFPLVAFCGHKDEGLMSLFKGLSKNQWEEIDFPGLLAVVSPDSISGAMAKFAISDSTHTYFPGIIFTKLNKQNLRLCDIAVLVCDIDRGFDSSICRSLELMKKVKLPFMIVARFSETSSDALKGAIDKELINPFSNLGFKVQIFSEIRDFTHVVAIVPSPRRIDRNDVTASVLLVLITGMLTQYLRRRLIHRFSLLKTKV